MDKPSLQRPPGLWRLQDRPTAHHVGTGRPSAGQRGDDQCHAPWAVATNIGHEQWFLVSLLPALHPFPLLKGPEISGEAIYYLAAAPEMAQVNGKFFNQTIEDKTRRHALDRELGKRVLAD